MYHKQLDLVEQKALVGEIKETEAEMAMCQEKGKSKSHFFALKAKCNRAWDSLLASYAKYINSQTKAFMSWGLDYDETEMCVMTGFMNAVREWNPSEGALSTIAGWKIRKEVQKEVQTVKRLIRLPENKENELTSLAKAERQIAAEFPFGISGKEKRALVCDLIGCTEEKYNELVLIRSNYGSLTRLDTPVKNRDSEEGGSTIGDVLQGDSRLSGERTVFLKEQAEAFDKVLSNLSPLEEYVYLSKLGIERKGWHNIKPMSYSQIAQSVADTMDYWEAVCDMPKTVTKGTMRTVYDRAISKLRSCEEVKYLDGYQDGKDIA